MIVTSSLALITFSHFEFAGVFGRHTYTFFNPSLGKSEDALIKCCKMAVPLRTMPDPGNCPDTWGKQVNDGRFIYDDSKVQLLAQEIGRRMYRVCVVNRLELLLTVPKSKTLYKSQCCWSITISPPGNSIVKPLTANRHQWLPYGRFLF